jgi:hypothetical protein
MGGDDLLACRESSDFMQEPKVADGRAVRAVSKDSPSFKDGQPTLSRVNT